MEAPKKPEISSVRDAHVADERPGEERIRLEAAEHSLRLLTRLHALASSLAAARTPEEIARVMVEQGAAALRASTGAFVRPRDGQLELVVDHGISDPVRQAWRSFPLEARVPLAHAYRARTPLWVETAEEYARRFPDLRDVPEVASVAVLPLLAGDRVLGVLGFRFAAARRFPAEERALLEAMAVQAAQSLDRAEAYAREVAARRRVESLGDQADALSRALTTADVARAIVDQGTRVAGADTCTLYALDEATGVLHLLGQRGCSPEVLEHVRRIDGASGSAVYRTLSTRETLSAETAEQYAALFPRVARLKAEGRRAQALWSVPLIAEDRAIGLLGMGFHQPRRFPPEDREFIATFARHCAEALLRARRLDAERAARALAEQVLTEKKREESRQGFLADAAAALAESLDYEATLSRVARLAVPALADWCAVDVVRESRRFPERLAVAHVDPAKIELAKELDARYPPDPDAPTGVPNVLRTGRPELYRDIPDELLVAGCVDEEHLRIARSLGLRSAMVVPLVARGRTLGAMSFVFAESGRSYSDEDLRFAEDLARRCAVAIDNARLFASEQNARASADVASRAKDEFLAVVSHELRTPLNAIMGWSKMMASPALDADRRARALETIERNAVAMAQLIEDLLDMSRIISGKMRLDVQAVDLARVIVAAIESIRPAADAKGVEVVPALDATSPPASGDPTRLQQIVWNLLSNAVKFTSAGGRVEVSLRAAGSSVEVCVTDTGKGIDPRFLPYVFDAFRQEDASPSRSRGGLGLGLAITRQLVELHGGRIEARSDGEGRGAAFTVHLPLPSARPEGAEAERKGRPATVGFTFDRRAGIAGLRVLVVDDDEDARQLVQAILEACGCRVALADGVDGALRALARQLPDVLLSDIGMPGRDGYELIRAVRALPAEQGGELPAAALTAYARAEDRRHMLNAGYSMHVPKPVDPAELVAVVATLARFVRGRG